MHDQPPCPVCALPPWPPPLATTSAAQALRAAFPGYAVTLAWWRGRWHFEAARVRGDGNPRYLVSQNPREVYDALSAAQTARTARK